MRPGQPLKPATAEALWHRGSHKSKDGSSHPAFGDVTGVEPLKRCRSYYRLRALKLLAARSISCYGTSDVLDLLQQVVVSSKKAVNSGLLIEGVIIQIDKLQRSGSLQDSADRLREQDRHPMQTTSRSRLRKDTHVAGQSESDFVPGG
ncbi:hypothetical protein WJX73_002888 [Symbiochloris irregularis]|uniref:Uncharacterized protein n=1 Tax=Symbiochloris irregularis TaxID=706552 RepID=A0AAW1NU75_9CHLO